MPATKEAPDVDEVLDGRYRVDAKIGYGAFGRVYRATDMERGETVAIKLFNEGGAESGYLRELGLLFSESHRRIVQTHGFGYLRGRRYIAYEYVGGGSLRDFLVRHPRVGPRVALEVIQQIGEGIGFAHRQRVVHRDLKPENILLEGPDWPTAVKICDFGLSARWRKGDALRSQYGSPAYMAPEQLTGDYDHRVDYYSMGVMLYEMLFGNRPYGGSVESICRAQAEGEVELPTGLCPALKEVLETLLASEPSQRPANPEAMEALIERGINEMKQSSDGRSSLSPMKGESIFEEVWHRSVGSRLRRVSATGEGGLVAVDDERILAVHPRGELEVLVGVKDGIDGFILGGDQEAGDLGWLLDRRLWRFRGGRVYAMGSDYRLPRGAVEVHRLPGEDGVLVVTPQVLEAVGWDGRIRWRASFQSYGTLPAVSVGGRGGHIALACEAPRTQLIGLDYSGERLFRTAAQANDACLVSLEDGTTIVGARSTPVLRRFDRQGFVIDERHLKSPLVALEALGRRRVLARGKEHQEVIGVDGLRLEAVESIPTHHELLMPSGAGLYALRREGEKTYIQRYALSLSEGTNDE